MKKLAILTTMILILSQSEVGFAKGHSAELKVTCKTTEAERHPSESDPSVEISIDALDIDALNSGTTVTVIDAKSGAILAKFGGGYVNSSIEYINSYINTKPVANGFTCVHTSVSGLDILEVGYECAEIGKQNQPTREVNKITITSALGKLCLNNNDEKIERCSQLHSCK